MSSPDDLTFVCNELVKDLQRSADFKGSQWTVQCMCQKRAYGCRIVFQLFDQDGQNMKVQSIMRVDSFSDIGYVHEFIRFKRKYLERHSTIVRASEQKGELKYEDDTLKVAAEEECDSYENSQVVD